MFPATKPQQCVGAASLTSNVVAEAVNTTRYLPDLDSVATMKVCRVCLATSVKMYHMLEHKLCVMYERVTGVEINTEDKLPKMLCWECVARLSSAKNFKDKALKTHWILVDKMNSSKFIRMIDIESIDRAQYQLESTLGFKVYEENDTNLYIKNESDNYHNDIYIKNEEEQMFNTEVNASVEEYPIKREYFDATDEQNVSEEDYKVVYMSNQKEEIQYQNANIVIPKVEYDHRASESDEEVAVDNVSNVFDICKVENHIEEEVRGVYEGIKQICKTQHSVTSLRDRSEVLPECNKPKVVIKDVRSKNKHKQDASKQLTVTAQSSKNIGTSCHSPIKKDVYDPGCTSNMASVSINIAASSSMQNNTKSSIKVFICDTCDKVFQNKKNLIRHIWKPSKVYSCTYCTYKTHSKQNLREHTNTKHTKSVTYNCEYCSYVTYIKRNLSGHINAKHTKNTVFNCPYCSFKTYRKRCLGTHVNSKHTKTKVFDCSYCSFKTYRKVYLNAHINTKHTKNISFDCSHCSYKTYKRGNLSAHVKSKHSNNSALNCSLCTYRAYDKKTLSAHVNGKHTKATVYNCSHCTYETYYPSSFYRHVKKHS